ncbi:MAG: sodium:solute symporter family protein [Acidobacteria bacterium]|nr:MAG: sodium:solute symporter family protein [Acidobacteriota bacterium]
MNVQLMLLVGYLTALVALGLWIGRRVRSAETFFVAGRSLGPGLLFATVLAANIGAGSTVGTASRGFRDGIAAWWWVGSAGIGTLLLAFWIGPRIWRLAKEHDLRTAGDYLELRFGPAVRGTVAAVLWLATLALLAGQLIAVAAILEQVAGVPKTLGCLAGSLVMVIYFAAGGLLTSAWVNLVQLVVIYAGFLVALPLAWSAAGGWQAIAEAAPSAGYAGWRGFFSNGGSGLVYVPLLVPAFIVSPGLLQKVFGARDVRAVRLGVGLSGLALMLFALLPALLGMLARARHPELRNPDLALPTLLAQDLPLLVGTLALAAVLSAEISSADAILFMLATSLSRDLYQRFLRPAASDAHLLRVARGAAVGGGALGVGLAILLPTVIDALTIFYSVLSVSLFVPLIAGLHSRRAGRREAAAAIGGGVLALVAVRLATGGRGLWGMSPTLVALAVSALTFGIAMVLSRRLRDAG